MEKEQFQKIMEALQIRQSLCREQLSEIKTTSDLSNLTLARAVALKSFCIAEEEVMTKIAMVDLYHIIGMGKLTPPQMMQFTYAIQDYLQYRPTIKAIAKHFDSITDLPKIPVETQYKLQGLGDVTLYSNFEHDSKSIQIDEASVEDYCQIKKSKLPFSVDGSRITVDMSQFDYFVNLMSTITKSSLSVSNFKQKVEAHKEYLGIAWVTCDEHEASGYFKSPDLHTRISGYYNKRI